MHGELREGRGYSVVENQSKKGGRYEVFYDERDGMPVLVRYAIGGENEHGGTGQGGAGPGS